MKKCIDKFLLTQRIPICSVSFGVTHRIRLSLIHICSSVFGGAVAILKLVRFVIHQKTSLTGISPRCPAGREQTFVDKVRHEGGLFYKLAHTKTPTSIVHLIWSYLIDRICVSDRMSVRGVCFRFYTDATGVPQGSLSSSPFCTSCTRTTYQSILESHCSPSLTM